MPLQGTPMMYQLLALDLVFDDVGDDVARIAALGHNPDLFLAVGQIIGQVDAAVAVPDQRLGTPGSWTKCGSFIIGTVPLRNPITISTVPSVSSRRRFLRIVSVYSSMLSHLGQCSSTSWSWAPVP
jgi:hypothetical protein